MCVALCVSGTFNIEQANAYIILKGNVMDSKWLEKKKVFRMGLNYLFWVTWI